MYGIPGKPELPKPPEQPKQPMIITTTGAAIPSQP
jgi:hypothetical protein